MPCLQVDSVNRWLVYFQVFLVKEMEELDTFQTFEERRVWVELEGSSQRKKTRQPMWNTREEVFNDNWSLFKQT